MTETEGDRGGEKERDGVGEIDRERHRKRGDRERVRG